MFFVKRRGGGGGASLKFGVSRYDLEDSIITRKL